MKTLLITVVLALFSLQPVLAQSNHPEDWIKLKFNQDFPNATHTKWVAGPQYYEVSFVKDGVPSKVFINKSNGSDYALTRYYDASKLKPELLKKVDHFVPKTTIYGVTEVDINGQTGYRVITFNQKHIYVVGIDENEILTMINEYKNHGLSTMH
ncbi:MAG: hypothetical protein M9898_07105 [Chitinophagaceae bacterium]|nr:hypothetical protein [Chitinophagaceae bacterium]